MSLEDTEQITKHELTRGALQLIIKLAHRKEPFKKAGSTRRWLRLCKRLREEYHTTKGMVEDQAVDFEKKFVRLPEDTDVTWQQRVTKYEDAFAAWEKQTVVIEITERELSLIEHAVKWAMNARHDSKEQNKPWPFNDDNVLSILDAFPAVCKLKADDDDSGESED